MQGREPTRGPQYAVDNIRTRQLAGLTSSFRGVNFRALESDENLTRAATELQTTFSNFEKMIEQKFNSIDQYEAAFNTVIAPKLKEMETRLGDNGIFTATTGFFRTKADEYEAANMMLIEVVVKILELVNRVPEALVRKDNRIESLETELAKAGVTVKDEASEHKHEDDKDFAESIQEQVEDGENNGDGETGERIIL